MPPPTLGEALTRAAHKVARDKGLPPPTRRIVPVEEADPESTPRLARNGFYVTSKAITLVIPASLPDLLALLERALLQAERIDHPAAPRKTYCPCCGQEVPR